MRSEPSIDDSTAPRITVEGHANCRLNYPNIMWSRVAAIAVFFIRLVFKFLYKIQKGREAAENVSSNN